MLEKNRNETALPNPLRDLTPAEFMALGGKAVVFIRPIRGEDLAGMMTQPDLEDDGDYHLVVSADGSPLMVGDSREAVSEWLADKNFGVVTVH
jgi:hypothetical protein